MELDEKVAQQEAVYGDLKPKQGASPLPILFVHYHRRRPFLCYRDCAVCGAARLADATSLRPWAMSPSVLSGASTAAVTASSSSAPAAISWAAVTNTRVDGGSK
jgi:hypothetical protein